MRPLVRPAFVALFSLLAAGCQTASLEDVAPTTVPVTQADAAMTAPEVAADGIVPETGEQPTGDAVASTEVRRNPGLPSLIPLEKTPPPETKEFVAAGVEKTGRFPTFGRQPRAANAQFSEADKLAAEAEMTELLANRASTPDARAQYEARLRQLRALAANHASDTQQEIEK
jgi:hypothetical protein